jgi:RluA family pseudouridine synthase
MRKRVITRAPQDPEWLDSLVAHRLRLGNAEAVELIARGSVHVDGKRITQRARVAVGAKLIVFMDPAPPVAAPLSIVHRDRWIAVVDKPPGISSQGERAESATAVDTQARAQLGPDARVMHRLDKEASGLLLIALDEDARAPLQQAFEHNLVDRRYVAIVAGRLEGEGAIRLRIARHATDVRLRAALPEQAPSGEPACSHYRALAHRDHGGETLTAVELTLETGRTHQLRVHLSAIGHPIVGDVPYGGSPHARLCLHAHALLFPHPHDGKQLHIHSPLPPALLELMPPLTSPLP